MYMTVYKTREDIVRSRESGAGNFINRSNFLPGYNYFSWVYRLLVYIHQIGFLWKMNRSSLFFVCLVKLTARERTKC